MQYEDLEGGAQRQAQSWVHQSLVREEPPKQSAVRIEKVCLPRLAAKWAQEKNPLVTAYGTKPSSGPI